MASKKKGGGKVVDLTVEVLKDIRSEMRGVREEIRTTNRSLDLFRESVDQRFVEQNEKLDRVVGRLETLEDETIRGFTAVRHELDGVNRRLDVTNARIDNLRDLTGGRVRDHDERLDSLEERVTALETRR